MAVSRVNGGVGGRVVRWTPSLRVSVFSIEISSRFSIAARPHATDLDVTLARAGSNWFTIPQERDSWITPERTAATGAPARARTAAQRERPPVGARTAAKSERHARAK